MTLNTTDPAAMLHPQARALLRLIEERSLPLLHTLPPEEARHTYRERRFFTQPTPPEVAAVSNLQMPGPEGPIGLRCYRPAGTSAEIVLPVLVYFHGGGWVIGDLDTHDVLCRELCNHSGVAVVAVDYRLAPEHRFPAAVDDAMAAVRWVHAHAAALRVDPERLAVGGDSAGGNLSAVVALTARDTGGPPIRFQLLIYPGTDQRCAWPSHRANGQGYLLTADTLDYFYGHYLPPGPRVPDWRISPLLHANHANLPPAFVLTAGYDPLHDEGLQYARMLTEAGSPAIAVDFPRQIHGFITMGRVLDEARTAVQLCAGQLAQALG